MGETDTAARWFFHTIGEVEDALLDLDELEARIGGSCELSSVRTSLKDAERVLHQMKGDL